METKTPADQITDKIVALINSKPQSPWRHEILAAVNEVIGPSIQFNSPRAQKVEIGQVATVFVINNGASLKFDGWTVNGVEPNERPLAILEWLYTRALPYCQGG
jgi:hypothetical protein